MWGNLLDLSSFSANSFTLVYHLLQLFSLLILKLSGKRLMSNCPRFFAVVSSCSWVTSYRKILILLTTARYLDQRGRSDKVLISCTIPHIRSGWHYKTRDCRVSCIKQFFSALICVLLIQLSFGSCLQCGWNRFSYYITSVPRSYRINSIG